jgi:hypothetical protein
MPRPLSQRRRQWANSHWSVSAIQQGPTIGERPAQVLGWIGIALGFNASFVNSDLWYVAAGLVAAGLLNAKTWEPPK